jgi:hypothetical protein
MPSDHIPGWWTHADRESLLEAVVKLPGGCTLTFARDDIGDEFAVVLTSHPTARARFAVGWMGDGRFIVIDYRTGETEAARDMTEVASLLHWMAARGGT